MFYIARMIILSDHNIMKKVSTFEPRGAKNCVDKL